MRPRPGELDRFESRLVWIFGSPRSGSTWLMQLLTHPLLGAEDDELGVRRLDAPDAGAPRAIPINEPYIPQHLAPALDAELLANEALPAATVYSLRSPSPNYFLADRWRDTWREPLRRAVLERLRAQADAIAVRYRLASPPVVIKEPNGSLGADFVMSLLPRARLLFLLRDGRDVVDSMLDARAPGGWLAGEHAVELAEDRLGLVCEESSVWVARTSAVQRAYEGHSPELRHLVRYEDARADPAATLAELDRWLGLQRDARTRADALRWNDFDSFPESSKGRGMPLRAARPGLWRENLSAAEQAAMHELMGAKLAELRYEVSD